MQSPSALGILHTSHPALFLFIFWQTALHIYSKEGRPFLLLTLYYLRWGEEGRVETESCFRTKAPTHPHQWRALSQQKMEKLPFWVNDLGAESAS